MKKRYAITMDEATHRLISIEAVKAGKSVGDLLTFVFEAQMVNGRLIEVSLVKAGPQVDWAQALRGDDGMDDSVKKAIEPDKTKESRGRLTKGLGDIPGVVEERSEPRPIVKDPSFGTSRPAPKPGK